ncbi:hypothetical protein [Rhizomonospora bruguierae]|uniref:hypothetical protein n=1 Tax=Rhizomonospora bruguierae TaxID=1581705 RepID=UPI001BCEEA1C|nr:hypothetical protein [Micromonospora sp. NBRC 107566]
MSTISIARYDILWIDQKIFPLDGFPEGFALMVNAVLETGSRGGEGTSGEGGWVHVRGWVLDEDGKRLTLGVDGRLWQIRLTVPADAPHATALPPLVPERSLRFRPESQGATGRPGRAMMINMAGQGFTLEGRLRCGPHDALMTPYQDGLRNRFYACSTIRCIVGLIPAALIENLTWMELAARAPRFAAALPDERAAILAKIVTSVQVSERVGELRVHLAPAAGAAVVATGRHPVSSR